MKRILLLLTFVGVSFLAPFFSVLMLCFHRCCLSRLVKRGFSVCAGAFVLWGVLSQLPNTVEVLAWSYVALVSVFRFARALRS